MQNFTSGFCFKASWNSTLREYFQKRPTRTHLSPFRKKFLRPKFISSPSPLKQNLRWNLTLQPLKGLIYWQIRICETSKNIFKYIVEHCALIYMSHIYINKTSMHYNINFNIKRSLIYIWECIWFISEVYFYAWIFKIWDFIQINWIVWMKIIFIILWSHFSFVIICNFFHSRFLLTETELKKNEKSQRFLKWVSMRSFNFNVGIIKINIQVWLFLYVFRNIMLPFI